MIETKTITKIDFKSFSLQDKALYEEYLSADKERGCEFSFANVYLWGRQQFAVLHDYIVLFSHFNGRDIYPYPLGKGDTKAVIDCIMEDAEDRGIPFCLTGLGETAKKTLEELYPKKFRFSSDEGTFDYVYNIDDLAELKGKKYDGKRNHLNRFRKAFPCFTVQRIDENNISKVICMSNDWYKARLSEDGHAGYHMEHEALTKALREYRELGLEGLAVLDGDDVLAFTLGSRLREDTFDVHFEKALPHVQGAYAVINFEFARYIREKYPTVRYLNREEDMGVEGLRKAKRSYYPHHMVIKYRACLE